MKKFFLPIIGVVFLMALYVAGAPAAETKQVLMFNNISGASAGVKYSQTINVTKYPNKALTVTGVTLSGAAFKNMSGTLIAQCSPNQGEPWVGAGRWQDSVGTAVSTTANSTITWRDYCNFVRFKWTAGTVGGKLKAWLNISE